jgi:hypothetical protein
MKDDKLKVRIITVTFKQAEFYLDRFLSTDNLYKMFLENFDKLIMLEKFNAEIIKKITQIPIRISLKSSSKYFSTALDTLPTILNPIEHDIEQIFDINLYIVMKYLKYIDVISDTHLIKLELLTIDDFEHLNVQLTDLNYLLTTILITNKFGGVDKQIIDYVFENDKSSLLKKNEQTSFYSTLFNKKRQQRSDSSNPRLSHKNKINKKYLSAKELLENKSFKEVNILHCPICRKSYRTNEDVLTISDEIVTFNCKHEKTIFNDYKSFSYRPDENLNILSLKNLHKWFNHNIKVYNQNNIYMVHILTQEKPLILQIIKYLNNKPNFSCSAEIEAEYLAFTHEVNCPICNKIHYINFDEGHMYKNKDLLYTSYKEIFIYENSQFIFKCNHNLGYENYRYFSIYTSFKYLDLDNCSYDAKDEYEHEYRRNVLELCTYYKRVWIDGKEMIKKYIDSSKFEIIDLSTYYEF